MRGKEEKEEEAERGRERKREEANNTFVEGMHLQNKVGDLTNNVGLALTL